jgi:hypothetical protein
VSSPRWRRGAGLARPVDALRVRCVTWGLQLALPDARSDGGHGAAPTAVAHAHAAFAHHCRFLC